METTKKIIKEFNMYEIRYYPYPNAFSKQVGRKLRDYRKACKIIKRLKKSGVDAFKAKMIVKDYAR